MAKSGLASSFERVGVEKHYRTIASVTGEVGSGKTHFCLTAPDPIVVFNVDRGLEGVVEKEEFDGKEIYQHIIDWSPGGLDESEYEARAIEVRNDFLSKFREAITAGARTIVVDTESRLWQIYRYAAFGGPNSGSIKDYDRLNQEFEDFINIAKGATVNLFLVRSMKNKWGQTGAVSQNTGKRSMAVSGREVWGYEHLPSVVMTELYFRLDETVPVDDTNEDPNYRYVIDFGKCRHNLAIQHTTVPRMDFGNLGRLMIPKSKAKDWI